jgi:hypothetical protein
VGELRRIAVLGLTAFRLLAGRIKCRQIVRRMNIESVSSTPKPDVVVIGEEHGAEVIVNMLKYWDKTQGIMLVIFAPTASKNAEITTALRQANFDYPVLSSLDEVDDAVNKAA